jgi:hypothetical protein
MRVPLQTIPQETRWLEMLVSMILPLKSGHGPMIASATDAGAVCLSTKVLVVPPSVYVVVIPPVTAVEMSPAVLYTLVTPPMTVVTIVPPDMAYLVTRGAKDAVVNVS